jgi:hypothetical protein
LFRRHNNELLKPQKFKHACCRYVHVQVRHHGFVARSVDVCVQVQILAST